MRTYLWSLICGAIGILLSVLAMEVDNYFYLLPEAVQFKGVFFSDIGFWSYILFCITILFVSLQQENSFLSGVYSFFYSVLVLAALLFTSIVMIPQSLGYNIFERSIFSLVWVAIWAVNFLIGFEAFKIFYRWLERISTPTIPMA
jgi:hypothetical protein